MERTNEYISDPRTIPHVHQTELCHQELVTNLPQDVHFLPFVDLPVELRMVIWDLVTEESRIVVIGSGGRFSGFRSLTPHPAALHVCRESRQIAELKYELTFSGQGTEPYFIDHFPPKIFFNFERDVVYFRHVWLDPQSSEVLPEPITEGFSSYIKREQLDRIKSIGLDIISSELARSLTWLNYYSPRGLRTLYICTEDPKLDIRKPFQLAPLEDEDHSRFLQEVKTIFSMFYWPPTDPERTPDEAIDFVQSKGHIVLSKISASLRLGNTPNICLMKTINDPC